MEQAEDWRPQTVALRLYFGDPRFQMAIIGCQQFVVDDWWLRQYTNESELGEWLRLLLVDAAKRLKQEVNDDWDIAVIEARNAPDLTDAMLSRIAQPFIDEARAGKGKRVQVRVH